MDVARLGVIIRPEASSFEPIHMDGCKLTPPADSLDMPSEERIAELREFWSWRIFLRSVPLDC